MIKFFLRRITLFTFKFKLMRKIKYMLQDLKLKLSVICRGFSLLRYSYENWLFLVSNNGKSIPKGRWYCFVNAYEYAPLGNLFNINTYLNTIFSAYNLQSEFKNRKNILPFYFDSCKSNKCLLAKDLILEELETNCFY